MKHGRFITLEGSEGAGKTTHLAFLKSYFASYAPEVVITREPGGTPLAERIRDLLLHDASEQVLPETELLLFFAARVQHWKTLIQPALQRGAWVICDRFVDASYAYQGGGRGLAFDRINEMERWLQARSPDVTLLFDLPVSLGLERASHRSKQDRFEREQIAFFDRVRQAYLKRVESDPARFCLIDASQSIAHVQQSIQSCLQERMATWLV